MPGKNNNQIYKYIYENIKFQKKPNFYNLSQTLYHI